MRPGDVSLGMRSWTRLLFVCLVGCLSQASQLSSARETSLLQTRILRPAFASALLVPQAKQPNVCNSRHFFTRNPVFPHKASSTALQAKKAKGKTKKDRQQEGEGLQRKESQVVLDVLAAAKEAGTGFESDPQAVDKLVGLLEELEECNAIENPARSGNLWGKWRLLFTNSPPMLKNKGVTGLGSLPFVGFEELTQEFQSDGTAETVEVLKMPPFGTPARSTLRGTVTAVSLEVIEQTYVDVQLASVFKSKADSVGSDNYFSKAVLAITYLSDSLRVCRSPSGAFFLFERVEFSR